jgi:hypothetical protein
MPLRSATTEENVGGALRTATFLGDKTFRVAAGTAPPTFIKLFSSESPYRLAAPRPMKMIRRRPRLLFEDQHEHDDDVIEATLNVFRRRVGSDNFVLL